MIRADLADARTAWIEEAEDVDQRNERERGDFLTYRDTDRRFADFHATRHSYITMVGKLPRISAREHQDLARHSSYRLTERYAHSRPYHLAAVVDGLPIPTGDTSIPLAATGTHGRAVDRTLTNTVRFPGSKLRQAETLQGDNEEQKNP